MVQDVSGDGALIAYTDSAKTLFVVPAAGGDPLEVTANVDEASFKGGFLIAFSGIDNTNGNADTATVFTTTALEAGDITPTFSNDLVSVGSARASDDGAHLFYETRNPNQEAVLDGTQIIANAAALRGRFSPTNDFLVVSADLGGLGAQIQAFPLAGGAPIDLSGQCGAQGCSNRFQITGDGANVIIGANEVGDFADLTSIPITGGAGSLIVQAGDNGFSFLDDGQTLIFINPDPANSNVGDLSSVLLGGAPNTLGPKNVEDISSTGLASLVYSTGVDLNTNLADLHFINADGQGDLAFGTNAKDEGFTSGDAFFLFLDNAQFSAATQETVGTFRALDTTAGEIVDLGQSVKKVSEVDGDRAAFLEAAGTLQLADLAKGSSDTIEKEVNDFVVFNKTNIAFSVGAGGNAGIFVEELK